MDDLHLYLENQKLNINKYTHYEKILLQGFYYGICAALSNSDISGSAEHYLEYAGNDFIQHYREYGQRFHGDFERLAGAAAAIPGDFPLAAQERATADFELWFSTHAGPAPLNTIFTTLADGNNLEEGVWAAPPAAQEGEAKPSKARTSNLTRINKTYKRRRSRALSPPRKIAPL